MGTANGSLYLKMKGELYEPLTILTDKKQDSLTISAVRTNEVDAAFWGFAAGQLSGWARTAIEEEGLGWQVLG